MELSLREIEKPGTGGVEGDCLPASSWALNGGSPCRLSNSRNSNIACLFGLFLPMPHVEFKKKPCCMLLYFWKPFACQRAQCRMSNLRNGSVTLSMLGVKVHSTVDK